MGNKMISQMATLLFLAIWHGLHSGYLLCFSLEFIIVNVEKQVMELGGGKKKKGSGDGLFEIRCI